MTGSISSTSGGNTTSTSAAQGSAAAASATFGKNFDTFLKLLTTQLQNQDPLSPMDTTQFTQQLVQFSSVEQSIRQNQNLETLISFQKNAQSANAVSTSANPSKCRATRSAWSRAKAWSPTACPKRPTARSSTSMTRTASS
ncbi:MAG: flagellar hook assembly protein FlgD [Tagaea sp.]